MIQRIQTIWLLLAGLAALLTFKFPFYAGVPTATIPYFELTGITGGTWILLLTAAVAVVSFVAIGLYKTRPMQLRLCAAGILLEALLIFLYYRHTQLDFTQGNLSLTSILHMLIVLFFGLAARGIMSDEKLIKESDRLR